MISCEKLKGKRYALLGLARSTGALAKSLTESNIEFVAWDDAQASRDKWSYGAVQDFGVDAYDYLIVAPGIPLKHAKVVAAKKAGKSVLCDIQLFREILPDHKIIAVTGTNGKSTTTALLTHILNQKMSAQSGGNIGRAVFDLDAAADVSVLELSSYQLELTNNLNAQGMIWLNLTPDHLDRHGSMENYAAAKARIFEGTKSGRVAAISIDDTYSKSVYEVVSQDKNIKTIALTESKNTQCLRGLSDLKNLRGHHNHQNIAACAVIAKQLFDMGDKDIYKAVQTFPGLPHRQYHVRDIGNVSFINDSKATNAEAAEKALNAFENIYWIAGGVPKEGGLNILKDSLSNVQKAYLIGDAQDDFATWCAAHNIPHETCDILEKAVKAAYEDARQASEEAHVLLSPACASFDQFNSFEQRGDAFESAVKALS